MEVNVDYVIRELGRDDRVGSFKSGDKAFLPLKTFLINQAGDFHTANVAKTYVAVKTQKGVDGLPIVAADGKPAEAADTGVLAFITLTCSQIEIGSGYALDDCPPANNYDSLPAVKIARLAVDARYRGRRLGDELVSLSLAVASDIIAPIVGCRFVVTDAKREAVGFYQKVGFTLLNTKENTGADTPVMFVDLLNLDQQSPPADEYPALEAEADEAAVLE